ncbi:MAG: ATP-binding protein [Chloroflexota bacterium]
MGKTHVRSGLGTWWGGSLRRRLLLSNVVTTVFFMLVLGSVALGVGAASLQGQVEEAHRRLAVLVAKDINAQYSSTIEAVELLHRHFETEAGSPSAQARDMRNLLLASPLTYRALYLFDATGAPLVGVTGPVEELATRPIEQAIAPPLAQVPEDALDACRQTRSAGMFTSPVQIVGADRAPVLYLGMAFAGEDGQVLVVEVDLRSFWQRVDEVYTGPTGRALVASRDGVIIAHPDRAYIGEPLPQPLRAVLDGYEGEATYTDPLGGRVMLAAYSPVGKQSGWGIVVEQEQTQALAPLRTLALVTVGVLLVAAVMAVAVTVRLAQSITRPILRLAEITHTIAQTGDLDQSVALERADEVGQLAATFNQMTASLRRVEQRTERLLEQQIAVSQLALALGETRDLSTIYHTIYEHLRTIVDAWVFIVSFYDDQTQLIRAEYAVHKGVIVDVAGFPPIPLGEPGQGTQSRVIHSGEPFYTPDHRGAVATSRTEYVVEQDGSVRKGPPAADEQEITRSALYVPMKLEGQTIGLMQLQSSRVDAYSQGDIDLLTGMASVVAVAVQNARLYEALQKELAVRMLAEESLRQSEERYRTVADHAYSWEYWRAPDGKILYMSPSCERITGYRAEEFITDPDLLKSIVIPADRESVERHEANVGPDDPQGGVHEVDFRILRRDGQMRWIAHTCQTIRRTDGTSLGRRATNRDITERKRAEEALLEHREHLEQMVKERTAELNEQVAGVEQLNRGMVNLLEDLQAAKSQVEETAARLQEVNQELNEFAYVVSHDLKAPLRAVTQLADWIATDYAHALDEQGQEMMTLLIGRTRRMHDLIQGILEYSRIGRVKEREKEVDLNWLVKDVLELLAPPPHIRVSVESDLPTLVGEQTRLEQVFANLLGNAIKFMDKPAGCVIIDCVDQGDHWLFSVADNGPGIEKKYFAKIFQMFQTLAPRDQIEGTGVGLALVKKIVETSGGRVWVESTLGQGSTFYFTLPQA